MSEVLVVIEDGVVKDVVSDDEDTIVHVIAKSSDKTTPVSASSVESTKVVDEDFDFDKYATAKFGTDIDTLNSVRA